MFPPFFLVFWAAFKPVFLWQIYKYGPAISLSGVQGAHEHKHWASRVWGVNWSCKPLCLCKETWIFPDLEAPALRCPPSRRAEPLWRVPHPSPRSLWPFQAIPMLLQPCLHFFVVLSSCSHEQEGKQRRCLTPPGRQVPEPAACGQAGERRGSGTTRQAPALCGDDLYSSALVPAELVEQLVNVTLWPWLQPWAWVCVQGMCPCASPGQGPPVPVPLWGMCWGW